MVERFLEKTDEIARRRVVLKALDGSARGKVVKGSDGSRYFNEGRRRIKGKIFARLGRWLNCHGMLVSVTYDPKRISRDEAWRLVGKHRRDFLHRLNVWRRRRGLAKLKCLAVIEPQKETLYPHVHFVFPYLKWLAPWEVIVAAWGQGRCNLAYKDSVSPVSYVCKYVSKMSGWADLPMAYLWLYRTRVYSMSREYYLPEHGGTRVPQWRFACCSTYDRMVGTFDTWIGMFESLEGAEDVALGYLEHRVGGGVGGMN